MEASNSFSKDVIKSSFKRCGLNISVDGSEDHLIHCFKDDQTCSTRAERLKVMASTIEDDTENPFSLLEDSDVEEAALVVDSDDETDDLLDI